MSCRFDVVALGELLIDFTENGRSSQGNPLFEANPGGAPCNVLAMLKKLGRSCAFIGKVGNDFFGAQLRQTAAAAGIDIQGLLTDDRIPTTLAFVKTGDNGERDFSFYRDPGADMRLREDELPLDIVTGARVFHFGTLSSTHPEIRKATRRAVLAARSAGALISFDPNLRPPLWQDMDEAREQIAWGLAHCDILKIADNELIFMTGREDLTEGARQLRAAYPHISVMNVTAGPDGSTCYCGEQSVHVPAFNLGGTIETTGAGDTFCACILNYVLDHGVSGLSSDRLTEMLRFANAAAYLITTKRGAIRSMPEIGEINSILAR